MNFVINKGEFVFLVGSSGSGKSTLIKLMLRELKATSGKIIIAGSDIGRLKSWQISRYRRKLGVVFQDFRLLQDRTVFENVAFAQRVIETPAAEIKRQTPRMLALVGLEEKNEVLS